MPPDETGMKIRWLLIKILRIRSSLIRLYRIVRKEKKGLAKMKLKNDVFFKSIMIIFLFWLFAFLWFNSIKIETYWSPGNPIICVKINKITGKITWASVSEAKWRKGKIVSSFVNPN